jgi:hypothetical protein
MTLADSAGARRERIARSSAARGRNTRRRTWLANQSTVNKIIWHRYQSIRTRHPAITRASVTDASTRLDFALAQLQPLLQDA